MANIHNEVTKIFNLLFSSSPVDFGSKLSLLFSFSMVIGWFYYSVSFLQITMSSVREWAASQNGRALEVPFSFCFHWYCASLAKDIFYIPSIENL